MLTRLANPDDLRDFNINLKHDVNEAVKSSLGGQDSQGEASGVS